jgi:hypothetical protein
MERDQVGNEDISTPSRNHVSVEKSTQSAPESGSNFESLDPEEEGKDEKENGNSLVIVAASN